MNIFNVKLKKLNITQIELIFSPFEWIIFPRIYRITPDMWVKQSGNYTEFRFLFLAVRLIHITYSTSTKDRK